jgi:hypothetical protein
MLLPVRRRRQHCWRAMQRSSSRFMQSPHDLWLRIGTMNVRWRASVLERQSPAAFGRGGLQQRQGTAAFQDLADFVRLMVSPYVRRDLHWHHEPSRPGNIPHRTLNRCHWDGHWTLGVGSWLLDVSDGGAPLPIAGPPLHPIWRCAPAPRKQGHKHFKPNDLHISPTLPSTCNPSPAFRSLPLSLKVFAGYAIPPRRHETHSTHVTHLTDATQLTSFLRHSHPRPKTHPRAQPLQSGAP